MGIKMLSHYVNNSKKLRAEEFYLNEEEYQIRKCIYEKLHQQQDIENNLAQLYTVFQKNYDSPDEAKEVLSQILQSFIYYVYHNLTINKEYTKQTVTKLMNHQDNHNFFEKRYIIELDYFQYLVVDVIFHKCIF